MLASKVIDVQEGRDAEAGFTILEAVLTALADWYKDKMYLAADTGVDEAAVDKVINIINRKTKSRPERKENFKKTKQIFKTDWCHHLPSDKPYIASDMFTYRVYHDYRIELHIPLNVKAGAEKQYKYVYIDSSNTEHEVCVVEWFEIDEMNAGKEIQKDIVVGKDYVNMRTYTGVDCKNSYYYLDGHVVSVGEKYGKDDHKIIYRKTGMKTRIIKMPELNYKSGTIKIKYNFSKTQRVFTGPEEFAAFIGALAKCSYDNMISYGSCYEEGTCFPSLEHNNGKSVDTEYLDSHSEEQRFINECYLFGFHKILVGSSMRYEHTLDGGLLHESHLHSGGLNYSKIKCAKENEK